MGHNEGETNSSIKKVINDYLLFVKVGDFEQDLAQFAIISMLNNPKSEHYNSQDKPRDWHNSQDKRQFIEAILIEDKEDCALYKALSC